MGRKSDRTAVINGVLDILALGSIVSVSLVAPNLVGILGKTYMAHSGKRQREQEMQQILRYMRQKKIISVSEDGGKYTITITDKGQKRAYKARFESLSIPSPAKWDERWRIVLFDIPEKHSVARRALTEKLKELGFKMIQKSVWVHPFPCLEQIELIKYVYPEASPYLVLLETDKIDAHNTLVKSFHNLL